MRKQAVKCVSALSLVCSMGVTNAIRAEQPLNSRLLSENCKQTWATAENMLITVPKILCREEDAFNEAFDRFMNETAPAQNKSTSGPKQESKFPRYPKPEHPHSTEPRKGPKFRKSKLHGSGRDHAPARHQAHGHGLRGRTKTAHARKPPRLTPDASAVGLTHIYLGTELRNLSYAEREELRRVLESLLKSRVVIAFLNAVQHGEGGSPREVVGGMHGKSADCQKRISSLDLSGHPKEQGLPDRCFLTTRKHGLSTAAGSWQIVYYRNWRTLRKLLRLKNFSERSQAIAALELVRTSKVPGGKVGEGLVALIKGDLEKAIRKGTDPWASSPYSRWRGRVTVPLLRYAREEYRRLAEHQYAKGQMERFERDTNS